MMISLLIRTMVFRAGPAVYGVKRRTGVEVPSLAKFSQADKNSRGSGVLY
jgi:hypothetical protein